MAYSAGRTTWRITTIRAGIAVYWLAMFLATHLPVQPVVEQLPASDKHLHLIAYGLLGAALPWWTNSSTDSDWRRTAWLLLLLLSYAAVDELLQIPVGRSAEWGDWLADAAGASIGILAGTWLKRQLAGEASK